MQTGFVLIKYIRSLLQILLIIIVSITIFSMILQTIFWYTGEESDIWSYEERMLSLSIMLIIGLIALFLLRGPSKKSMKMKAEQREKALDYEGAVIIWEALEEFDEAARVRKLKVELTKSPNSDAPPSKTEQIKEYKELLDSGAIDEYEFKQMKKEILGK